MLEGVKANLNLSYLPTLVLLLTLSYSQNKPISYVLNAANKETDLNVLQDNPILTVTIVANL